MRTRAKSVCAAVVLAGCVIPAGRAPAADRPAEAILAELDAIKLPTPDSKRMRDQAYRKEHFSKLSEGAHRSRRSPPLAELCRLTSRSRTYSRLAERSLGEPGPPQTRPRPPNYSRRLTRSSL